MAKTEHTPTPWVTVKYEHGATGSSAAGAICFIQRFSRASGTPTYVIEDSTDNSAWATLLSMTTTGGAAPHTERKTVTGNVDRYLRLTTTGTFTTAIVHASFRRGTSDDRVSLA